MENSGIIIDLIYLFAGLVLSFLLYPVWISFVYKFQMGEDIRPEGPSTHLKKVGTPTMGGMVIVIVTALITLYLNKSRTQTLFPLFIATIAGLLGLFEDFTKVYRKSGLPGFFEYHLGRFFKSPPADPFAPFAKPKTVPFYLKPYALFKEVFRILGSKAEGGLQSHQKMVIQFGLAGFVSYWTFIKLGWDYIWLPLIGNVHIGILYPIFIFFFFIFILNTVSISDGLDGLAGGLALIAALCFWTISAELGYNSLATFCATFVGAMLPFLYFNIYPARVFMGNVGSHFIGAFMAMLAIVLHREVAFLFIGLVFLFDGFSSPLQQISVILTGKRIFRMAPFHHHFELLGWPETKVTLRFWIVSAFFAFFGLFIALL
jgi:phospho-N-acetylmuramoyl-pentapeptide-transferase